MRREAHPRVHRRPAARCTSAASTARTTRPLCTSAGTPSTAPANDLLSINWRAPARRDCSTPPPSRTRTASGGGGAWTSRTGSVLGFVDEPLDTTFEDHLTDAIVEDITRQRVGEMRQIIADDHARPVRADRQGDRRRARRSSWRRQGKTAVGLHRAALAALHEPAARPRGRARRLARTRRSSATSRQVPPALGEGGASSSRDRRAGDHAARRDRRVARAATPERARIAHEGAAAPAVGPPGRGHRRAGLRRVTATVTADEQRSWSRPSASARSRRHRPRALPA